MAIYRQKPITSYSAEHLWWLSEELIIMGIQYFRIEYG